MMAQFMMDLKTEPRLSPSLYSPASPKMADSNGRPQSTDSGVLDLSKRQPRLSPSLYSPASPKMADSNGRPQSTDSGVLDLSKRRDSLDARKTPSPAYHCFSEVGGTPPPSNHSSPQQCDITNVTTNPANTILLNYGELVRARRLSPTKSLLQFEELSHHHTQNQLAPAVQAFHRHGMVLPKQETDILQQHLLQQAHRAGPIPSYLLPTSALQHHHPHQQPTSPAAFSPSPIRLREMDALSESGSEGTALVSSSQRKCKEEGANTVPKDGTAPSGHQQYPMVVGRDGKLSRPFKAYPRDPLSLAAGFVASDTILDTNSAEKYNQFRKRMLEQIHAANGGQPTVSNPKMRRLANSTKSGHTSSSSNAPSAIMSDASSSESCDEKPSPNERHLHPNLAACDEMAQYVATNQRPLVTPSRNKEAIETTACGVIGSSDASSRAESKATEHATAAAAAMAAQHSNSSSASVKDSAYYERRKKNNAAAKKSRDRRRIKEDEIAIRAAFLERENIELKFELAAARKQLALYGVTSSVAAS
uniref:BZIP domain-containing protein n=1 Tax=Anopheles culicifacies TaxID=139723 RepID=A0A182LV38_9DIPT